MLTSSPRQPAPLDEFLDELQTFKRRCCVASDRQLASTSGELYEQYRRRDRRDRLRDDVRLCPLSASVICEVFKRKRRKPPRWDWVATYVLTCLHIAERSGVWTGCDKKAIVREWYERYQVMLARLDHARPTPRTANGLPAEPAEGDEPDGCRRREDFPGRPDTGNPGSAVTDGPVSPPPEPPPGPPATPLCDAPPSDLSARIVRWQDLHDAALADAMDRMRSQQSMAHRRYYRLLGQHGVDLLMAAESHRGDPEAACRLGILLLCHDHPHEGMAWLHTAAEQGDAPAKILINAAPSRRRQMAAELAYEFTLPGYAQDRGSSPTYAEVYYRAAATAGHLGAIVRLGFIFEARGETIAALHTYARAADRGHHDGRYHFWRLNDQLTRELNPSEGREDDLPPPQER